MDRFTLPQGKPACLIDVALYGTTLVMLPLTATLPQQAQRRDFAVPMIVALLSWSAILGALHRFTQLSLQPFRHWRAEPHRQPLAPDCALVQGPLKLTFRTDSAWNWPSHLSCK